MLPTTRDSVENQLAPTLRSLHQEQSLDFYCMKEGDCCMDKMSWRNGRLSELCTKHLRNHGLLWYGSLLFSAVAYRDAVVLNNYL